MPAKSKRLPEEEPEVKNTEKVENTFDIQSLMNKLDELQKKIDSLEEEKNETVSYENPNKEKISSDDYIKVMSLNPYELNLTTERNGRGKIFTFNNFGDVKNILYGDLVLIIETHSSFLNDGRFVILDSRVIRRHGLDEAYSKLLTKENFDAILDGSLSSTSSGNQSDAVKLFENANEVQRESIRRIFIDKILAGEEVDLNFLDRLKRIGGYSITERAENIRRSMEILNEENKNVIK